MLADARVNELQVDWEIQPTNIEPPHMHKYAPLDTNKPQIRLLKIRSSTSTHDQEGRSCLVQCDIEIFDIEKAPEYITLSYVWGPPNPTRRILLDGRGFDIRENLFDFLETFRDDQRNTRYIWIDQLCINQQNDLEKSHQVGMMSQIYRRCRLVIAWLGKTPQTPNTDVETIEMDLDNNLSMSSTRIILENLYFTRLWIVQEILLPPEVFFMFGSHWIALSQLHDMKTVCILETHSRLKNGTVLVTARSIRHAMRLEEALYMFSDLQCEDLRDKIYGLLSLAGEDEHVIRVDYRKSTFEVFIDVVDSISRKAVSHNQIKSIAMLAQAMELGSEIISGGKFDLWPGPDLAAWKERKYTMTSSIAAGSITMKVKDEDVVYEKEYTNANTTL